MGKEAEIKKTEPRSISLMNEIELLINDYAVNPDKQGFYEDIKKLVDEHDKRLKKIKNRLINKYKYYY